MQRSYRIRIHSTGGEGGVIASEVLAEAIGMLTSFHVLQSPFFGTERSGAPAITYLSFSDVPLKERGTIEHPNGIVLFNTKLFTVVPGLLNGYRNRSGKLIVNTDEDPSALRGLSREIFTVDATAIARRLQLGSATFPIPNMAMVGAILKAYEEVLGIQPQDMTDWVKKKVPLKLNENLEALKLGFNSVRGVRSSKILALKTIRTKPLPFAGISVTILPSALEKTGSWATLIPSHQTGVSPCSYHCPAGIDVRRFVRLISDGKAEDARQIIFDRSPFPSVCGRVCPHFCEMNCNRGFLEGEVRIGQLERFVGDLAAGTGEKRLPITKKERVGIIGAGPGGLTAGWDLLRNGYRVTLFEKHSEPGGMLVQGIPEYRLPRTVLEKEIIALERAGLKIKTGVEIGANIDFSELATKFDAIIVAVGRQLGKPLGLSDDETCLRGVIQGIDFLRRSKAGERDGLIIPNDRVVVVGGGNTAIDAACSALRWARSLGNAAPEVTICYRREMRDMPAFKSEVERAQREGVAFKTLLTPSRVIHMNNVLSGIEFVRCRLGEADESGRRIPVPIPGSETFIPCDKLIVATGQCVKLPFGSKRGSEILKEGLMEVVQNTPVFFLDDPGTVAEAIGAGHRISSEVRKILDRRFKVAPREERKVILFEHLNVNYFERKNPVAVRELLPEGESGSSFSETILPYTAEEARTEAQRCFSCGECNGCDNCYRYCPEMSVVKENGKYGVDLDYCKGCLVCVQECPRHAIEVIEKPSSEGRAFWKEKVRNFKITG